MASQIIMPKAGMAMEEGKILRWLKQEGDKIEKGDTLLEIETDKVSMEVEANDAGYLIKVLKSEGETVPVTQTIGYIGELGESIKELSDTSTTKEQKIVSDDNEEKYDVVVIGGGPAGYVSAIKASQLGGKVALVEKDVVGGTCLNRGCIPTKTYLKSAEIIENIKHAASRGITIQDDTVEVNMAEAVKMKNKVVKTLTSGVSSLLRSNGIKVYQGVGKITKDKNILVDGKQKLITKKIILAGGSKVSKISIPGVESPLVLTSDEILDLNEIPKNLAIIGGGVIGVEMAVAFKLFGSNVTIIELADRIIPLMDNDISTELERSLKEKGINIVTSVKLERIEEKDNSLYLYLDNKKTIECDKALLSIGRIPDLDGLGEIEFETDNGRIKINNKMETSIEEIYAPGDINGKRMLAHAAFKMGETAAENAMGKDKKINLKNIPSCVYTIPEVGCVGLTEDEAVNKYNVKIGKFPFGANGRALASGEGTGFVKVITDQRFGEVLGVHIIGPGAAEMINEAAALMEMEITAEEIAKIIHGHPTYSEAFMEATADSIGSCIHLPKK